MFSTKYEEREEEFLQDMATKYGFTGKTWNVFKERFSQENIEFQDKEIATALQIHLTVRDESDPCTIFRDHLKKITNKLGEAGCDYKGVVQGRWEIARQWLREIKYPEWLANHPDRLLGNFWEQLWSKVTSFEGITFKTPPQLETAGLDPAAWEGEQEKIFTIGWDNKLSYEINSQQPGYLTLIQKYSSGELYFLSPSCFVKQPCEPAQQHIFPSAKCSFLPLQKYVTGMELLVAVVSQKNPSFSWVKAEDQKPLKLQDSNLQELLEFIEREPNCEIIGTKLRIVDPVNRVRVELTNSI